MTHILDRPIWSALRTRHANLAEGGPLALRFHAPVSPFAAIGDDGADSLSALGQLATPGETLLLVQASQIIQPPGFAEVSSAAVVQMISDRPPPTIEDARITQLGWQDAQEMFELATLTRPGPFTLKALSFGDFWGIRIDGRLVAMAGERLKQPGYTELSGVCTHPDVRGKGLGRLMSLFVAGRIFAKGEQPYLHCYATNDTAIRLYQSIGFRHRQGLNAVAIRRENSSDSIQINPVP